MRGGKLLNGSVHSNTVDNHENRMAGCCFTHFNNKQRGYNKNRMGSPSHHRSEEACIIFLSPPAHPPPFFPSNNPWEFERHPLICSSRVPPPPPLLLPLPPHHLHPLTLPPSFLLPDVSRITSHSFRSTFIFISVHFLILIHFVLLPPLRKMLQNL